MAQVGTAIHQGMVVWSRQSGKTMQGIQAQFNWLDETLASNPLEDLQKAVAMFDSGPKRNDGSPKQPTQAEPGYVKLTKQKRR